MAVVRSEWSPFYPHYFTPRERAPVTITRELGSHSQIGCSGKNINLLSPQGIQPIFIHPPVCSK
jgi:hypothetical protein